MTLIGAKIITI